MSQNLDIRDAVSKAEMNNATTDILRKNFLVENIFTQGDINLTYTYIDRQIVGGVMPNPNEELEIILNKDLGVNYFLERRELGVINIGEPGYLIIDGERFEMENADGFYIGKETRDVKFGTENGNSKFYIASAPAHHKYPNKHIKMSEINPLEWGESETCNERKIYQYVHPNVTEACQLQMGYTHLSQGSNWNTMPCHTHARRMETYLYCNLNEDHRVFHILGEPDKTKHIVVANEQAVINPSWSVHSGVGTDKYSFIWAMCGENIAYDDMDFIKTNNLK